MFGHVVDGYKSEFPFPGTSFPAYPSRPSPARWWVRLKLGWPSAPLLLLFNPGPARRWLGPVNCLPPPVVTCPPPGQDVTPRVSLPVPSVTSSSQSRVSSCSPSSPSPRQLTAVRLIWAGCHVTSGAVWVSRPARNTRGRGKSLAAEISEDCSALTVKMRLLALFRIIPNYTTATGPAAWWVWPVTPGHTMITNWVHF